jgi:CopA family copper-resistance protein
MSKFGNAVSRRSFTQGLVGAAMGAQFIPGCAGPTATRVFNDPLVSNGPINLEIESRRIQIAGSIASATTINGGVPGPEIRLKEGQDAVIRVTNRMDETSSIHWHGILLPPNMDGVPGISYDGIAAGETFEYRFPLRQNGTYWYHSHSGFQEQTGVIGALIVDKAGPESEPYDREFTILLSDWTFEDPATVSSNLKKYGGYYNFQRPTLADLGSGKQGFWADISTRLDWAAMRMDSSDIADVTGATYTYLMNGQSPLENWHGVFTKGERIRLRFINASAASYFDVRIPGLEMSVIYADGQAVSPVMTDEFRLAIAETLDVIVAPTKDAYTIFAEAMDRSGYALGTLATAKNTNAPIPARRKRPTLSMVDMGMKMDGMDMAGMEGMEGMDMAGMEGMDMSGMQGMEHMKGMKMAMHEGHTMCPDDSKTVFVHGDDEHGAGNSMVAEESRSRFDDPGVGLRDATWRVLKYSDLRRALPRKVPREPDKTIELHLTGNMERYMWSFNGVQYDPDMPDITVRRGQRIRIVLINDSMMAHPIHLHGMFFELDVGACDRNPLKHTVSVNPAERISFAFDAEEVGRWAFHCHILYHMEAGMFRVLQVKS